MQFDPVIRAHQVNEKEHFHSLDGLRGVAAVTVMLFHGSEILRLSYIPPAASLAVDFFFLLSGFVIAHAYDDRLNNNRITWSEFIVHRFIRLYPMLFVGTSLGAILFLLGNTQKADAFSATACGMIIVGSFILLPVGFATNVSNAQGYPLNNPVWSLFFEFFINGIYAIPGVRANNRIPYATVVASAVCLVVVVLASPISYQDIGFGSPTAFVLGFVRVSYSFFAGVLAFRLASASKLPTLPIGLASVLLFGLLILPIESKLYTLVLVLLAFPALVIFTARAQVSRLAGRLCLFFGELSYPLYLTHQPIFRVLARIIEPIQSKIPGYILLTIGIVASAVISQALLIGLDRPARARLKTLLAFVSKRTSNSGVR